MRDERASGWLFWGYTLGTLLASLLMLPWLLWKILSVKNRRTDFLERMGLGGWVPAKEERPFWIHGVSVGEVLATAPLVGKLRRLYPDVPILVSSITPSGRAVAEKLFKDAAKVICFPFDHPLPVWLCLRKVRPRLFLHTESEIWPFFLLMLGRLGIPAAIVNGRISESSCRRFARFRFFLRQVLLVVRVFAMQTRADCRRIIRIGADPRRVHLTGNMKFDAVVPDESEEAKGMAFREETGLGADGLVLVAGSTHDGEEQVLLSVFAELKREMPGLKMLLAPRHPERCDRLERVCRKAGVSAVRRTRRKGKGNGGIDGADVLLLDTMGELVHAYAVADVVFLGGSLVPIGGHNPLEAMLHSKPVLFGPHTEKIADTVGALLEAGGGIRVVGREDLFGQARALLADPARREAAGRAAFGILAQNRGATDRNLAILRPFL